MKEYEIYILNEDKKEFILVDKTEYHSSIPRLLNKHARPDEFVLIKDYTYGERSTQGLVHIGDIVCIDGEAVMRCKHDVTINDIERLKKKLPVIYRVDGTKTYLPYRPLTADEVNAITGKWFTMKVIKDEPSRWAILFFDDKQFNIANKPHKNEQATKEFGFDLYGDVLLIEENYVS